MQADGDQIRKFRRQAGWTQEELSDASGLSVRAVAKAEGGRNVSEKTIAAIAHALEDAGQPVTIADLSQGPRRVAIEAIAHYRHDFTSLATAGGHLLSPAILTQVRGHPSFAGDFRGLRGFNRFLSRLSSALSREEGDLGQTCNLVVELDTAVAWGRETFFLSATGIRVTRLVLLRMQIERAKICEIQIDYDC